MKESAIQKQILEYLSAERILAFRMNSGAMSGEYNGKTRFMRFGVVGMADVLAFARNDKFCIWPTWIEVKTLTGRQSEFQKSFQAQVEAEGHTYILARSVDDVIKEFGE
jgi:hypothetical protein